MEMLKSSLIYPSCTIVVKSITLYSQSNKTASVFFDWLLIKKGRVPGGEPGFAYSCLFLLARFAKLRFKDILQRGLADLLQFVAHALTELCYTQITMKVYLDACCLNRPFDDQSQPRVRLETEAISLILGKLHQRDWEWVGSEMLLYEIRQNPDLERRQRVLLFAAQSHQVVEMSDKILRRAEELEESGFDSYDAIHLALAEHAKVDVFLTTDDQILKVARRNKELLSFLVENPVKWLEEVLT